LEATTDAELLEILGWTDTASGGIKKAAAWVKTRDEHRAEIEATAS
jgi:hypothetical protein